MQSKIVFVPIHAANSDCSKHYDHDCQFKNES